MNGRSKLVDSGTKRAKLDVLNYQAHFVLPSVKGQILERLIVAPYVRPGSSGVGRTFGRKIPPPPQSKPRRAVIP